MNIFAISLLSDQIISEKLFNWRTDWGNFFFLWLTKLGNWQVILSLTVIILAFFYFYRKRELIYLLIISIIGTGLTVTIIKHLINRPRPGINLAFYTESGSSFPSAHAAFIFALFGFLIYCLGRLSVNFKIKILLSFLFILIIILVGFSRLYLGVHFLSDVLAGYLIGGLWLLIGLLAIRHHWF